MNVCPNCSKGSVSPFPTCSPRMAWKMGSSSRGCQSARRGREQPRKHMDVSRYRRSRTQAPRPSAEPRAAVSMFAILCARQRRAKAVTAVSPAATVPTGKYSAPRYSPSQAAHSALSGPWSKARPWAATAYTSLSSGIQSLSVSVDGHLLGWSPHRLTVPVHSWTASAARRDASSSTSWISTSSNQLPTPTRTRPCGTWHRMSVRESSRWAGQWSGHHVCTSGRSTVANWRKRSRSAAPWKSIS
mmetsp:Transcript_136806/g.237643  ORF Transcript_136806/g.237643 Transcript_136806/m.237643 type:complete len:244 (-) Transcript_136806:83-814(-)